MDDADLITAAGERTSPELGAQEATGDREDHGG
jgi:hypothetical protein